MANCPQCGAPGRPHALYCTRCGAALAPESGTMRRASAPSGGGPLPAGTALQGGRYQILRLLGEGGMGAVYLAADVELFGRTCVVKQMRPFFASQTERRKAEDDFKREAEVLAQLNQPGHPHIPEVYSYFVEGGDQFLVMKYVTGENLEQRLQRLKQPLAEQEVIRCAAAVADALVYLHSRRPQPVVHRDIKPANIIVDPEDRVWLVDFGLARASTSAGARLMMAGGKTVAAGTPGYTPLEQWQMQTLPRSDIYALGATMHHLLTAQDPRDRFTTFPELNLELLRTFSTFSPVAELRPGVSSALADLVTRCLDPDPRRRPDAEQLKIELDRLSPTGSRLLDTARRWSPTLGQILGTALATFVRMLFGRSGDREELPSRTTNPTVRPTSSQVASDRPALPCLYCRGQGVTAKGKTCPICRGTGVW